MSTRVVYAALLFALAPWSAFAQSTSNVFDVQAALTEKNTGLGGKAVESAAGGADTQAGTILGRVNHYPILTGSLPFTATGYEGGETIADAILIEGLPYNATGFTCDNVNDYDEVCPYEGSTSPDVVYRYEPPSNQEVFIDLCPSGYDTKVYVYENAVGNLVACNDDFPNCGPDGYRSRLLYLNLNGGNVYYVVVDGYGGDCGVYSISITFPPPCTMGFALQYENEPPCHDGYVDSFNGGCNSNPAVFTTVQCQTIRGRTGTYLLNGLSYRDTDWYRLTVGVGPVTVSGRADHFPLRLSVLTGDCPMSVMTSTLVPGCVWSQVSFVGPSTVTLFVAPEQFDGVPCESAYEMQISGPHVPFCATATQETSWGRVKGLFRP